ncbi:MAG: hypothetical protein H7263_15155 [Candidatus Sericytochromatia bacterium]|nr:hypothetical protein [Candidatus Sericytochromatia bacterium]
MDIQNSSNNKIAITEISDLKPPSELSNLNLSTPITKLNTKDIFVTTIKPTVLMKPLELFHQNEIKTNSNKNILSGLNLNLAKSNNINKTIIETGSSTINTNAIKQYEGQVWLGKLSSNGNREVAIIIPKGADYSKPFEIVYHFHGHNGKLDQILTDKNYGLHAKIDTTAKNKNIIIVIPQGPIKALDYTWFNGKYNEDMSKFQQDTISIIKNKLSSDAKIGSVTVEGHSAGGRALLNASREGKLNANKIDFLDASYGNWASETYNNYSVKNPNAKFNIVYIPNSQTQTDALSLKNKNGVTLKTSQVDHSSVPKTFFDF